MVFKEGIIGRNVLAAMVKSMFEQLNIKGKTNHSLRATGVTRMFEGNVPHKMIKQVSGHKTDDALMLYERPSTDQILSGSGKDNSITLAEKDQSPASCFSGGSQTMFKDFNNCTL